MAKKPDIDPIIALGLDRDPCYRFFKDLCSEEQRRVWKSTALYQVCGAAQRAGKTTTLLCEAAAYVRGLHPARLKPKHPVRILVIAPARAQLATIFHKRFAKASQLKVPASLLLKDPTLEEITKAPLIPENDFARGWKGTPDISYTMSPQGKSPGRYGLIDGSEIFFHISGDRHAWERIMGNDYHAVFRDEAVGDDNLTPELMLKLLEHQGRDDEPNAGFYKWFATEVLVNDEFTELREKCEAGAKDHEFAYLSASANPAVPMAARKRMAESMSVEEANKRIWATTTAREGMHVLVPPWNRHRHLFTEPYVPQPEDNLFISLDPGWKHACGLIFAAISPDNPFQLKIIDCFSETRKTIEDMVNVMLRWTDGRFIEALIHDPDAKKSERSDGQTLIAQLEDAMKNAKIKMKRGMMMGRNRYEDTIPLFLRYLNPDPENPTVEPLIKVNPPTYGKCGFLIDQIERYQYKKNMDKSRRLTGDAINRVGDDLVDPCRYLISRQPTFIAREPNVAKSAPLSVSAIPIVKHRPDPLEIKPGMSEDQRRHLLALRESARMTAQMTQSRTGTRSIQEVYGDF